MKEFKEFVTEYYKTIGSVVVILAMVIACAVTLIQKRTANTDVMAKMISITPLYEDNITTPEIDRITYYAAKSRLVLEKTLVHIVMDENLQSNSRRISLLLNLF